MRMIVSALSAAVIVAGPAGVPGCQSQQARRETMERPRVAAPLEFDPTETYEIVGWWSNSSQMIRFDRAGNYALYDSVNRYEPPIEHGTWRQQNYAVLWLAPYTLRPQPETRIAVSKIDGEIAIRLREFAPMRFVGKPPRVPEDDLLGTWVGERGAISLGADGRYVFSAGAAPKNAPVAVTGHLGAWRLEDRTLILSPDSPALRPIRIELREAGDAPALWWRGDELRRTDALAAEGQSGQ